MKKLLRILTVHSVRDLLKYKSFFLLVFIILAADRILPRFVKTSSQGVDWPHGYTLGLQAAQYVFEQLPAKLSLWLFTPEVAAIAAGLFVLKQVISLWPSSDMRRMHRRERGHFGLLEALAVLRWHQVLWDALAVGTVCGLASVWFALAYLLGWGCWQHNPSPFCLLITIGLGAMGLPVMMAGFSYSSKLAVVSSGSFGQRFRLFLSLFSDWTLLWTSWLFFSARIVVELIFVAVIPAGAILYISNFWLRMLVATLSATPVYSYLKMASFKFFLEAFGRYALVRNEYEDYFAAVQGKGR